MSIPPPRATAAPAPLATPRGNQNPAGLRRAAQDFEAQALGALLQPMFQGLDTKAPFGGGAAEGQWRPMLVDAIAKDLAKAGGLGIGEAVLRELTRLAGQDPAAQSHARQNHGTQNGTTRSPTATPEGSSP
ncbi:rod-binding protein [Falsiroseomonas tokyonensis]|uniref:Rod-binding protein n=1 Tax=Falsiroseomonas tokyonensis TaxID=430521 RepID=A0ABV7BT31_9PROT|nr:rod-binding protein [Falsiroseomonas tokyonensis]MBU8537650.1 rod-binding protein [Falsiroseomonas tokyonensis]